MKKMLCFALQANNHANRKRDMTMDEIVFTRQSVNVIIVFVINLDYVFS